MKNDKLENLLIDLGLSDNEARIYLASLVLGPSTILKIARAAETKRTTVYSVVESLKQKGLMNIEVKGWKNLFTAENPEKLYSMIENKREKLKKNLPEFSALYNLKGEESNIKYYEGLEGIKSVYKNLLKDIKVNEDYLVISNRDVWLNLDKKFFMDFIKQRSKLNINNKLLLQDSKTAREFKKFEKNYNEKIKILPKETTLTTSLVIIPKRVVIHQLTPPIMAMVIENKSIIKMHRELFYIIWNKVAM
jgi:sugar-specific transcriptional regulator TrmB